MPYNEGFPNVIVSELEILESENKIYAATFGRGIWEGDLVLESVNTKENPISNLSVQINPNPNDGHFQLQIEGLSNNTNLDLAIVDIMGRRVLEQNLNVNANTFSREFDLDLAYGLYFLSVKLGDERKVIRFVVE